MSDRYDVVIVGGGPSGATAGTVLARSGLSVAIVDEGTFPRSKPCAGAISGRAAGRINAMHGEGTIQRIARAASNSCRMFDRDAFLSEGRIAQELLFVDRLEFDAFLLGAARAAGCEIFEQARVRHAERETSALRLRDGRAIHGSIIIGADGARSTIRRSVWNDRGDHKLGMGFGLVADVPADGLKSEELRGACLRAPHIFFGVLPWGYGWIFPRDDTLSVGVGGLLGKGARFREAFDRLLQTYFRDEVHKSVKPKGHPFPFGAINGRPGRGNVLLVGDAAGLVEPVTGEGIASALESGELAAEAAAQSFAIGKPADAGETYNRLIRRFMLSPLRQAAMARWFLFAKPFRPIAMRSLKRHPKLVANYLEVVAGKLSYSGYIRRLITELLFADGEV